LDTQPRALRNNLSASLASGINNASHYDESRKRRSQVTQLEFVEVGVIGVKL